MNIVSVFVVVELGIFAPVDFNWSTLGSVCRLGSNGDDWNHFVVTLKGGSFNVLYLKSVCSLGLNVCTISGE